MADLEALLAARIAQGDTPAATPTPLPAPLMAPATTTPPGTTPDATDRLSSLLSARIAQGDTSTSAAGATTPSTPTPDESPAQRYARLLYKGINRISPIGPALDVLGTGDPLQDIKNIGAGAVRGAGSIGATLLAPVDWAMGTSNAERRTGIDQGLQSLVGSDPNAALYKIGKTGAEIAGTAGAPGAAAKGLSALPVVGDLAAPLASAIESGGMATGLSPSTWLGRLGNLGLRAAGGAAAGGLQAGLVDPAQAATGAKIGAVSPLAISAAGKLGQGVGRVIRGPDVPDATRQAAQAAGDAGYVIPPTQVRPSLGNRALEGTAGKLTTAQNASVMNQKVTNDLVMRDIGAKELTTSGLADVRATANAAYDRLGQAGQISTDPTFKSDLANAGTRAANFGSDFPFLVNKDTEGLLGNFAAKDSFDANSGIEAIKRLREGQRAAAMSPAATAEQKAYGTVQGKTASALENLMDRNLADQPELLADFRNARQTLAKTYDVEKALTPETQNVDARVLARQLAKGRPMTGGIRTAAEFGSAFPTAAKMPEKMGSLPQFSPLDVFGGLGAAFGGSMVAGPLGTAAGLAVPMGRMGARYAALSPFVQSQLARAPSPGLLSQFAGSEPLLLRSAPILGPSLLSGGR